MAISFIASATANGNAGGGGTASITHGLTIQANDVLIALVRCTDTPSAMSSVDSVFTEDYARETDASSMPECIYSRVAGSSEASSWSWTVKTWTNYDIIILQFRGVDTSDIWDVIPAAGTLGTGYGTTATAPSITTETDGAMGLLIVYSAQAESDPTDDYADGISASLNFKHAIWRRTWATAGATSTAACTLAGNCTWRIHQVALKPAAGSSFVWLPMYGHKTIGLGGPHG